MLCRSWEYGGAAFVWVHGGGGVAARLPRRASTLLLPKKLADLWVESCTLPPPSHPNGRYRDLLILDPSIPTPSPSTLLIRERAMVVNLEAVRMIITANQVFLLSGGRAFGGGGGDQAARGKPGAGLLFALMAGVGGGGGVAATHGY